MCGAVRAGSTSGVVRGDEPTGDGAAVRCRPRTVTKMLGFSVTPEDPRNRPLARRKPSHPILGLATFHLWIFGTVAGQEALPSQGSRITIKLDEGTGGATDHSLVRFGSWADEDSGSR